MSKHPSPRADQLRAMREAQFARHEQLKKEAEKDKAEKPAAKGTGKKSKEKKA